MCCVVQEARARALHSASTVAKETISLPCGMAHDPKTPLQMLFSQEESSFAGRILQDRVQMCVRTLYNSIYK